MNMSKITSCQVIVVVAVYEFYDEVGGGRERNCAPIPCSHTTCPLFVYIQGSLMGLYSLARCSGLSVGRGVTLHPTL